MLLEAGLLLVLIPWSTFWDRNYFAQAVPFIGDVVANGFVRGAVSGLGVVNVLAALAELIDMVSGARQRRAVAEGGVGQVDEH